jgi:hypothetical protein
MNPWRRRFGGFGFSWWGVQCSESCRALPTHRIIESRGLVWVGPVDAMINAARIVSDHFHQLRNKNMDLLHHLWTTQEAGLREATHACAALRASVHTAGQAQVAGPSLRGGSPRLDGSARPGVPLSQGSRFNSSPRAHWRRSEFSGSGAAGAPPPAALCANWSGQQSSSCKARPVPWAARAFKQVELLAPTSHILSPPSSPGGPRPPSLRGLTASGLLISSAGDEIGCAPEDGLGEAIGPSPASDSSVYGRGPTVSAGEPKIWFEGG